MNQLPWARWLGSLAAVLLAASLFLRIDAVPFHPDETSWLVQSEELERFVANPASLAYTTQSPITPEVSYRLLNAPAAKVLLAVGRILAGYTAKTLPQDWNWRETWETNVQRGAMPHAGLLWAGRVTSTALVALSLIPMFLSGRRLGGKAAGWLTVLLFVTNALVLLHGRRAMAEGALLLAVNLVVVGTLWGDRYPWLTGIVFGMALSTKQSTLALLPVALLGAAWGEGPALRVGKRLAVCGIAALGVWALLNPVAWRSPAAALTAMADERRSLVEAQVADFAAGDSFQVARTPAERLAALLAALYFADPQMRESSKYDAALAPAQQAYLASPLTHLLRGQAGGSLALLLTLFGIALGARRLATAPPFVRRDLALLLLLTLAQAVGLLVAIPLAFQRYYLPLVPLCCLWIALAVTESAQRLRPQSPGSAT